MTHFFLQLQLLVLCTEGLVVVVVEVVIDPSPQLTLKLAFIKEKVECLFVDIPC